MKKTVEQAFLPVSVRYGQTGMSACRQARRVLSVKSVSSAAPVILNLFQNLNVNNYLEILKQVQGDNIKSLLIIRMTVNERHLSTLS